MATDEDLLIKAAKRERRNRRSGRNLLLALAVAAVCAVIGWVLIFRVRAFVKAIPFLPLGTVTGWLLVIGIAAFVSAGLIVAGALLMANPRKRWGDPAAGACPACGSRTLRQDTVEPAGSGTGSSRNAPKGVVTLCYTKNCGYASATVTTASRVS
ncbi:MAG TPA: hypothetical protein VF070_22230 [Streptosporangiaceae bacterium]